ncbi:hypothetical protein FD514_10370 [Cutibacterium acnes]|nr:hypothetical protein COH13_10405 [Cutibacterium acnes]REB16942.1 hypothetical protein COH12_08760 [Cutibacterium acnes]TLG14595.1 hypothetical protein FD522_03835 [Cutibacterium acnes]TLG18908.1 hypothetical protein FD521_03985 [Cutibacterium acnes]TLG20966.1 hypothetical protein FD516_08760 [Cutibacterium acnes]
MPTAEADQSKQVGSHDISTRSDTVNGVSLTRQPPAITPTRFAHGNCVCDLARIVTPQRHQECIGGSKRCTTIAALPQL